MYLINDLPHLQPGWEVARHDDDGVLKLSVHLGRQLGVGELCHRHQGSESNKINKMLKSLILNPYLVLFTLG